MTNRGWLAGIMIGGMLGLSACSGMTMQVGIEEAAEVGAAEAEVGEVSTEEDSGGPPVEIEPSTDTSMPVEEETTPVGAHTEPEGGHGGDMRSTIRAEVLAVVAQEVQADENPMVAVLQIEPIPYGGDDQVLVYGMTEVVWSDGTAATWEDIRAGMILSIDGRAGFHADKITIEG